MHEYAVTREIVRIAEEYALQCGASAVEEITLVIGCASGCAADCIGLYFDLIAAGSRCENAKLKIKTVAPKLRCETCGGLFHRKPFSFQCPDCGGQGLPTEIGREFYVESVQVAPETFHHKQGGCENSGSQF